VQALTLYAMPILHTAGGFINPRKANSTDGPCLNRRCRLQLPIQAAALPEWGGSDFASTTTEYRVTPRRCWLLNTQRDSVRPRHVITHIHRVSEWSRH